MTLRDIFDTPISELWNMVSPWATGYLVFVVLMFAVLATFIIFVAVRVFKGHRKFNNMALKSSKEFKENKKRFDKEFKKRKKF